MKDPLRFPIKLESEKMGGQHGSLQQGLAKSCR